MHFVQDSLNRLHLRAPPLSLAYEKEWPSLRDWFAVEYLKKFKENCGMHFIRIVNEVIEKLDERGLALKGMSPSI